MPGLSSTATTDHVIEIPGDNVPAPAGHGLLARLGAELLGTFVLVFFGVGVALYVSITTAGPLAVALAFGVAVAGGAAAFGHISGGHFNPAVSLGAAIAGRISFLDLLPYWFAQLVGGVLAGGLLAYLNSTLPYFTAEGTAAGAGKTFFTSATNGYGSHSPIATATGDTGFPLATALIVEAVLVAIFVAVILGVTDRRAKGVNAPITIGLTLSVVILVAMPFTNASINPVRSTATALFSDSWALGELWAFWVAPLIGAAIAGAIYRLVAVQPTDDFGDLTLDDFDFDDEELEETADDAAATPADAAPSEATTAEGTTDAEPGTK